MSLGRLLGGGIGFLVGGPAGAAIGMGLGGAAEEAVGGGATGAARDAARTQAAAADRAAELQRQTAREQLALQQRMYEEGVARQQPWLAAGQTALNKLIPEATSYTPFGMQQFQQDPGYGFRMSEGMKALERSAAARGGLLSGATMKGVQRFGQDLASQEYQNAFNRYGVERERRLAPLQSLAGVGQTTANTLAGSGQAYANAAGNALGTMATNVGNLYTQTGETAANALLAGQQARGSAYGQLGNVLGRYLGTPAVGGFGGAGINPASGEYYGSLEF